SPQAQGRESRASRRQGPGRRNHRHLSPHTQPEDTDMLRRHLAKALATVVAGAPTLDACALWGDQLTPFVAETVTRDDNVSRLADGVDPLVALGAPSGRDTYHTTSAGFAFKVPA